MGFSKLGVKKELVKALTENNITTPTEVQEKVIPFLLSKDDDLIGIAQTGTGKTAAYGLPILQKIDPKLKHIQALVLVPTRELGHQVARQFFLYTKYSEKIFAEAVYGGKPIEEQIEKLKRGAHILVATPGRLIDLLDRGAVDLSLIKYLVLDEADEMLNMGFKSDIDDILAFCHGNQTNMLFSATMPNEIMEIIHQYMKPNAHEIRIKEEEFVNKDIDHQFLEYTDRNKVDYLKSFLLDNPEEKGILFCRTRAAAIKLDKQLAGFKIASGVLHKEMNQEARDKVMRAIRKDRIQLLIATDIAARGIDIQKVDYVINYHLPERADQYTHRSGRTARAGKKGRSICFITPEERDQIRDMEYALRIKFKKALYNAPQDNGDNPVINTYYINIGMAQEFNNNKFLDFISKETAIVRNDIKNVWIEKNMTTFDMDKDFEKQLIANLKGKKFFHRNMKISRSKKEAKGWSK